MAAILSNFGMPEHPRHAAYGQAVNVQFIVSQGHEFSISIAIPISIWMIFPNVKVWQSATGSDPPLQVEVCSQKGHFDSGRVAGCPVPA